MRQWSLRIVGAALPWGLAITACGRATTSGAATPAVPPAGTVATASSAGRTDSGRRGYTAADVHFMSGMIVHHAQAVLIAGWAPTHDAGPAVRTLCERIVVAQQDEIASMQRWLRERHETVPDSPAGHAMPGMEHAMLMPGMLTPEELARLNRARGVEFDRLFLTSMIRHHQGAITMVDLLFGTQGAARDGLVFRFAADVSADQSAEIDRMSRMLAALP